ncbi:hypothetical protein [Mesobacillus subterraneus]|uniref:Uncharacterized protein n=1 Tax=Mesobacillus subterraneus TaxID=285983 RepID=A0A3R9F4Q4_9BACI|nr:hypothetical protein [Mesobacillus subterraneus]RSD28985.1 hypothetical protein EJA10_02415 [Mesobacillus subterraneus]
MGKLFKRLRLKRMSSFFLLNTTVRTKKPFFEEFVLHGMIKGREQDMNQNLIGIYKGELSERQINELKDLTRVFTQSLNTGILTTSIQTLTLLVAQEDSQLTAGHTDRYYLLTQELQKLPHCEDEFYFVYDYRKRKFVENPMRKCFSLMKISIVPSKLEDLIQTVKDIKQDVFAGFNICAVESGILVVDVLLTSPILERIHKGGKIPDSLRSDQHYLYLAGLTELLADPAICNYVHTRAIGDRTEF